MFFSFGWGVALPTVQPDVVHCQLFGRRFGWIISRLCDASQHILVRFLLHRSHLPLFLVPVDCPHPHLQRHRPPLGRRSVHRLQSPHSGRFHLFFSLFRFSLSLSHFEVKAGFMDRERLPYCLSYSVNKTNPLNVSVERPAP